MTPWSAVMELLWLRRHTKRLRSLRNSDTIVACRHCGERIIRAAKRCQHCGSYQGFFRHNLLFLQTAVTIFVAAIAVVSVLWNSIMDTFFGAPNIIMEWTSGDDLENPAQLTTLEVLVQNTGRSPAVLNSSADFKVPIHDGTRVIIFADLKPQGEWDRIMEPGEMSIFAVELDLAWIREIPTETSGLPEMEKKCVLLYRIRYAPQHETEERDESSAEIPCSVFTAIYWEGAFAKSTEE